MNEQAFDKKNAETENNDDNMTNSGDQQVPEDSLTAQPVAEASLPGPEEGTEEAHETEKLRNERDDYRDKYLRLVAEFDNFRKRNAKERNELIQTAGKAIIQSLLEVMDDADRAMKQLESSEDLVQIKEGVTLVFSKFRHILQQKGLKRMESINQAFDPELHEAITEVPAPAEDMRGKVMDEIQPGYYLNEKLIRHAKVVVGK